MKPEVFTENTSFQSKPQEAAEVPALTTDATRACSAVHRPLQPIDLCRGELARFIVVPMDHRCRNLKWILFFQSILGINSSEQYLVWMEDSFKWQRGMSPDATSHFLRVPICRLVHLSTSRNAKELLAVSERLGLESSCNPLKARPFHSTAVHPPRKQMPAIPCCFQKFYYPSPKKSYPNTT